MRSSVSRSGTASVRSLATRSRAGTAATAGRQAAFLPNHDLKIRDRPVTAAGGVAYARGNKASPSLPSRQIQDETYYVALLRSKEKNIENEIMRLEAETKQMEDNCHDIGERQRVFDELLVEVRELEDELANYNLASEKERNGVDPEDVENFAMGLKESNIEKANEADRIFMENQKCQEEIEKVENEISKTHEIFRNLLENSDEATIQDYQRLTNELKALKEEGNSVEAEIVKLRGEKKKLQSAVLKRSDSDIRSTYDSEQERVASLKTALTKLDEELRVAEMSADEARVYLLDKVKEDKSNMADLEKESEALEEQMRHLSTVEKEKLEEIAELESAKSSGNNLSAHESMHQKSKEAENFMLSSENTLDTLKTELASKQATIVTLLKSVSQTIDASKMEMPTKESFESLSNDVNFKAKHLENSKQTMNRLMEQKEKRKIELEKIQDLEAKIHKEEVHLRDKIRQMKEDMEKYEDLDGLEDNAEEKKEYLMQMNERYSQRGKFMASEAKKLSVQYEKDRSFLKQNETWQSLQRFEEKLCRQGQVVHSLKDFVKTKKMHTDYESIKVDCINIAHEVNQLCMSSQ